MKCIESIFLLCLMFSVCQARTVVLPQPPFPCYDDTESSVSAAFPKLRESDRFLSLSLLLTATTSNCVEVAFGTDKNGDGDLSLEESELSIGWSCGKWFFADRRSDVYDLSTDSEGEKSFVWRLIFDEQQTVRKSIALEDGKEVLVNAMAECRLSYFSSQWNMVRVTTSGIDYPLRRIMIQSLSNGLSISVR